uniref:Uncharacterized protein n=1 Tax=Capra hircus TaxID=9925 RepID=A0A8C2SGQ1_CAPHI
ERWCDEQGQWQFPWPREGGPQECWLRSAGEKRDTRGKNQSKEPERPLPPLGPVTVDPKGGVCIAIHAKPGSKQNAVTDVTAEAVSVAIAAPPTEGEANAELCRYLSKVLELRKSDVVLDKGGKSPMSTATHRVYGLPAVALVCNLDSRGREDGDWSSFCRMRFREKQTAPSPPSGHLVLLLSPKSPWGTPDPLSYLGYKL